MDTEVVGLGRYLSAIWRRAWVVLAAMLIFGIGAFGYISAKPAQYSATAAVLIQAYSSAQFNEPEFSPEQVATQVEVMHSLSVVAPVVKRLNLPQTPPQLLKSISAKAVGDTSIIEVIVTRGDPKEAASIANALAVSYLDFRSAERPPGTKNSSVGRVVSAAITPKYPSGRSPLVGGGLGGVVGFVIGCIVALVMASRDKSLPDEAAVAETTGGLPVLGRIPRVRARSRARGLTLFDNPTSPQATAYRFLATTVRLTGKEQANANASGLSGPPVVMMVVSAAPRDGRTSVAANVALAAAEAGQRVLVCDADLTNPHLSELLGVRDDVTLSALLQRSGVVNPDLLTQPAPNLFAIGTPLVTSGRSALLVDGGFRGLVSRLGNRVDLVVVDTAPLLSSPDVLELLSQSDLVVLAVRERKTLRDDLRAALDRIAQVDRRVAGIVLTSSGSSVGTQRSSRRRASSANTPASRPAPSEAAAASTLSTHASST